MILNITISLRIGTFTPIKYTTIKLNTLDAALVEFNDEAPVNVGTIENITISTNKNLLYSLLSNLFMTIFKYGNIKYNAIYAVTYQYVPINIGNIDFIVSFKFKISRFFLNTHADIRIIIDQDHVTLPIFKIPFIFTLLDLLKK